MTGLELDIASIRIGLTVGPRLRHRLRRRYGDFLRTTPLHAPRPQLRLISLPDDSPEDSRRLPAVRLDSRDELHVQLLGDCVGSLDVAGGHGVLERGAGFIGVDAMLRLSLSMLAPGAGWVLLHGAAMEVASGGWALLLGPSGAGKSTAARAFTSWCDELVLARPEGDRAEAASTPYWNGHAGRAPCRALVCLERAEVALVRQLRGGEAVRALLEHVVRHVPRESADRTLFERICALARAVPVLRVRCTSGPHYPGELARALQSSGLPLRWSPRCP